MSHNLFNRCCHFAFGDAVMWLKCVRHSKYVIFTQTFAMSVTRELMCIMRVLRAYSTLHGKCTLLLLLEYEHFYLLLFSCTTLAFFIAPVLCGLGEVTHSELLGTAC